MSDKTNWGKYALIGLGIWYFFFRPNGNDLVFDPKVSVDGVAALNQLGSGGEVAPGETIKLQASLTNQSTSNGDYVDLPVTVRFTIYMVLPNGDESVLDGFETTATLPANSTVTVDSPSYEAVDPTPSGYTEPWSGRRVWVMVLYNGQDIAREKFYDVYSVIPFAPALSPDVGINSLTMSYV